MANEIKSLLGKILKVRIDDFEFDILGSSEKGDGYLGDIVFVSLKPKKQGEQFDLVLKCSKKSETLRKQIPIQEAFLCEINLFKSIIPAFTAFQKERKVENPFKSVCKCFGTFANEHMEILVLQNLKKQGYNLWDKQQPLTRAHIELVLQEYARFHSISLAMQDQNPEDYRKLIGSMPNIFEIFCKASDVGNLFGKNIEQIGDLLKDELGEEKVEKWKSLIKNMDYILYDMIDKENSIKVAVHGDCWCNNFMFKNKDDDAYKPTDVVILDWQFNRCESPITDLSYFIFAGISKEDIDDLDAILEKYYRDLHKFTEEMGSNLDGIYPKDKFFEDWTRYCKFGFVAASLIFKVVSSESEEVLDIAQLADGGRDFSETFSFEVKNKDTLRERAKHVVEYAVNNDLL